MSLVEVSLGRRKAQSFLRCIEGLVTKDGSFPLGEEQNSL